jgi:hypothetical protein
MNPDAIEALIRDAYEKFGAREEEAFANLLTDDFRFSSPDDPRLDKAGYFERCWPNAGNQKKFEIEKVFVSGDEAFIRYEITRPDDTRFRNSEFFRVRGGKIAEVQVYYGAEE